MVPGNASYKPCVVCEASRHSTVMTESKTVFRSVPSLQLSCSSLCVCQAAWEESTGDPCSPCLTWKRPSELFAPRPLHKLLTFIAHAIRLRKLLTGRLLPMMLICLRFSIRGNAPINQPLLTCLLLTAARFWGVAWSKFEFVPAQVATARKKKKESSMMAPQRHRTDKKRISNDVSTIAKSRVSFFKRKCGLKHPPSHSKRNKRTVRSKQP